MDIVWPIVILVVYFVIMAGVALYSRKRSKSLNDFFLGGRGMGGWMSAFSYGTTYFSAVIFIGYSGKFGWTMGLSSIWIGIGNALVGALLAWFVLARRVRLMSHKLNTTTMPQLFAERYNSRGLKLFAAAIIFIFLLPYSASVYQGIGYLFELVFGIDYYWCIIIMAAFTALYLFFGGYLATSLSDFIQGIIMVVGVVICVCLLFNEPEVNWGEGIDKLTNDLGLGFIPSAEGGFQSVAFQLSTMVLLTSFGIWALPQSVHKYHAVRDGKAIRQAMIISTVLCAVIGIGAYLIGSMGHLFFDAETVPKNAAGGVDYDAIIPEILVSKLHPAMVGLMLVLLLAASMSTLASMSLAGSSALAVDAYKGFIRPKASEKKVSLTLRITCVLFIAASVLLAVFKIDAIVTLMSLSWGTLAGCFMGPFVLGIYSKRINKAGCWASLCSGLIVQIVMVSVLGLSWSAVAGVLGMIISMIVTPIASIVYSRKVPEKTETLFAEMKAELKSKPDKKENTSES